MSVGFDGEHHWVQCSLGHVHYGEHGAAGMLLYRVTEDGHELLMQERAPGVDHAGTWGWPGGAIRSGETVEEAARREMREEAGLDDLPEPTTLYATHHGGWSYTTLLVEAPDGVDPADTWEGVAQWVSAEDAVRLPLVPGAALALRTLLAELL